MTKNLIVYNASAGSGKTFVLALEYIALCLSSKDDGFFRRILAITFTNKAAHELKKRIIQFLAELAAPEIDQTKIKELQKRIPLSAEEIQERAEKVLETMLHNYGDLNVSTIDSFVLSILRAFSKELGMAFDFDLELDGSRVKDILVESIMSKVGKDDFITSQLARLVTQNLDDGRAWNPKRDMKEAIDHLMDEESIPYREQLAESGESKLKSKLAKLEAERISLRETILNSQKVVRDGMSERGLEKSHFNRGTKGFITFAFKDLLSQTAPSEKQIKVVVDGNFSSSAATKAGLGDVVHEFALDVVVPEFWKVLETLSEFKLKENLYKNRLSLVLALRLQNILKKFEKDERLSVIKDNNFKIAAIIDNNPTPFIYERVGRRYQHFLIDEFQDTSILQWRNMLPLIDGSLAYGRKNFLVGDVKQSIYRWRGGEADQMVQLPKVPNSQGNFVLKQIEQNLDSNLEKRTLDENYRSSKAIVSFNNELFQFLGTSISENHRESYANVAQGEQRSESGYVELRALQNASDLEDAYESMLVSIQKAERDGYHGSDICILTRNNRHGQLISKYLESQGYSVSSPDSLLLNSHAEVQLLVNFLLVLSNTITLEAELYITYRLLEKSNKTASYHQWVQQCRNGRSSADRIHSLCAELGYEWSINNYTDKDVYYCLNVLCVDLALDTNDAYIQELLNVALSYIQSKDSTILGFYEHWKTNEGKLAVKAGANRKSIQLMTIHKSKGLQFPVVIIPYLNWKTGRNTKNKEWITLTGDSLDVGLLDINQSLNGTPYEYLLTHEQDKTKLDDLNLLYVAFTRAEDRMYIQVSDPSRQGLAQTLVSYIETRSKDESCLSIGEEYAREINESISTSSNHLSEYECRSRGDSLSLALSKDENESSFRAMGQILHAILEKSIDLNQAVDMLEELQHSNALTMDEVQLLKGSLENVFTKEEQQGWSNHSFKTQKEIEVISPKGKVYRMDKVLIDETAKKIIVIDYKTGQADEKHKDQMQGYLKLLQDMDWQLVEGYLLYTSTGILEKV